MTLQITSLPETIQALLSYYLTNTAQCLCCETEKDKPIGSSPCTYSCHWFCTLLLMKNNNSEGHILLQSALCMIASPGGLFHMEPRYVEGYWYLGLGWGRVIALLFFTWWPLHEHESYSIGLYHFSISVKTVIWVTYTDTRKPSPVVCQVELQIGMDRMGTGLPLGGGGEGVLSCFSYKLPMVLKNYYTLLWYCIT